MPRSTAPHLAHGGQQLARLRRLAHGLLAACGIGDLKGQHCCPADHTNGGHRQLHLRGVKAGQKVLSGRKAGLQQGFP